MSAGIIKGSTELNETMNTESSPVVGEQILGRANYFAHRLSIDSQTPLNNNIDSTDFALIPAAGRSNNTDSVFGIGLNPRGKNVK